MLIMMMECRKFSPDTPTCPAEGGADPSLTTFTPITVQSNTGRGAQPEEGDKSEFKGGGSGVIWTHFAVNNSHIPTV